ncbi:lipocalin family protein [Speluncibacter jeojiensis]|nr:lipocalin family protein [Rhodococcus sp. D2-41]
MGSAFPAGAVPAGPIPGSLPPAPAPVAQLSVDRYLGNWHQLAAIPQPYNVNCARDTEAHYGLDATGAVTVHNTCTTLWGSRNEITGTATVNDPVTRAQLHVSFPGVPTQNHRSGPTNYIVTALGPDYSWAVVTDPYRVSGFVLSRNPSLDPVQWRAVKQAVEAAGENTCVYLTSPTVGGLETTAPMCLT